MIAELYNTAGIQIFFAFGSTPKGRGAHPYTPS